MEEEAKEPLDAEETEDAPPAPVQTVHGKGKPVAKVLTPEEKAAFDVAEKLRRAADANSRAAARARARAEAEQTAPRGSFSFRPGRLQLQFKAGVAAPARVAAVFSLEPPKGTEMPSWWAPPMPIAVNVSADGCADFEGQYLGTTGMFSLSETCLSELVAMSLKVAVHEVLGKVVDPKNDPQLGSVATVALARMLTDDIPEIKETLTLGGTTSDGDGDDTSPGPLALSGATSTLRLVVSCDDNLAEFAFGGCILRCGAVSFAHPPLPWVPAVPAGASPEKAHADLADLAEAHTANVAAFDLSVRSGSFFPRLEFGPGALTYTRSTDAEVAAATAALVAEAEAAAVETTGPVVADAAAAVPLVPGSFALTFAAPRAVFLARASRSSLRAALADGEALEVVCTMRGVGKKSGDAAWSVLCSADPLDLLADDSVSAKAIPIVVLPTPIPAPDPPAWFSKAVDKGKKGSEKGKRERAASSSSEAGPSPAVLAAQAQALSEAITGRPEGRAFRGVAEGLWLTSALRSAAAGNARSGLTADDVVPPRRAKPTKQPRDFKKELRQELGEMVRTVAEEYECLFPRGDAEAAGTAREEQQAILAKVVSCAGLKHDFQERLKPRVQRMVRSHFGHAPVDTDDLDFYLTQLYSALMAEVNGVLAGHFAQDLDQEKRQAEERAMAQRSRHKSLARAKGTVTEGANEGADESAEGSADSEVAEVEERLEDLRILAMDAEANADWKDAWTKNEDRVTEAVKRLGAMPGYVARAECLAGAFPFHSSRFFCLFVPRQQCAVANAWYFFGHFCLRAAAKESLARSGKYPETLGKAAECFQAAVESDADHGGATQLLGAVLLEQGRYEKAAEVLQRCLDLETPSLPGLRLKAAARKAAEAASDRPVFKRPGGRDDGEEERSPEVLAEPSPLSNVLMCLLLSGTGRPICAQKFLSYAVRGFQARGRVAPGVPRRTAVVLAIEAAEFLATSSLPGLAALALDLAAKSEAAAVAKAAGLPKSRPKKYGSAAAAKAAAEAEHAAALVTVAARGDGVGGEPAAVTQRRLRVTARLAFLNADLPEALPLASRAVELDASDADAWALLGDIRDASADLPGAAEAYERATDLAATSAAPPLRLLVRLGALYLAMGRFQDAKQHFIGGSEAWQTCSMWLGVGVALLRLEAFGDAECALQEALVRNNQSAPAWGYSCLLCLNAGESRLSQADRAREVAERLDLKDPTLLRELGNAYTSADRLETAEALFRRSLAQDDGNVHTRRRLADVLAAQNAVADAVNEYIAIVDAFKAKAASGEFAKDDRAEVLVAIGQSKQLLKTLGRTEELPPLRALERELQTQAD